MTEREAMSTLQDALDSGEVIPKADTRELRWCLFHRASAVSDPETNYCRHADLDAALKGAATGEWPEPNPFCNIVYARLWIDTPVSPKGRLFDPTDARVIWWCDQNMMWDEGPSPRDCTPEQPHSDESGRCAWALVIREATDG